MLWGLDMYGDMFKGMFETLIVGSILVGAGLMAAGVWLVPLLWEWVKPWLHSVTG